MRKRCWRPGNVVVLGWDFFSSPTALFWLYTEPDPESLPILVCDFSVYCAPHGIVFWSLRTPAQGLRTAGCWFAELLKTCRSSLWLAKCHPDWFRNRFGTATVAIWLRNPKFPEIRSCAEVVQNRTRMSDVRLSVTINSNGSGKRFRYEIRICELFDIGKPSKRELKEGVRCNSRGSGRSLPHLEVQGKIRNSRTPRWKLPRLSSEFSLKLMMIKFLTNWSTRISTQNPSKQK